MQFRVLGWARYLPLAMGLLLASQGRAEAQPKSDSDERFLEQAGVSVDDESLRAILTRFAGSGADPRGITGLIRQLDDPSFRVRAAASQRLVSLGPAAIPSLREAQKTAEGEVAARVRDCLKRLERNCNPQLGPPLVRLAVRRNLNGAIPPLLRALAYADTEELVEDVWFALDALTVRQGKVDPAFRGCLRRGQAACRRRRLR